MQSPTSQPTQRNFDTHGAKAAKRSKDEQEEQEEQEGNIPNVASTLVSNLVALQSCVMVLDLDPG